MPKIQEPRKGQLTITIPQQIAKLLGWKKGTELIFSHESNYVRIEEIKSTKNKEKGK